MTVTSSSLLYDGARYGALRRASATTKAVAGAVSLSALLITAVALVLEAIQRPPGIIETWYFAVDVAVALVYSVVSWLILARRPHAVGWIFALAAIGGALAAFGYQYALLAVDHPNLPASTFIGSMVAWGWVPGTLALVTVVPWQVRNGPLPWHGRVGVAAGWAAVTAVFVVRITDPWPWPEGEPLVPLAVRNEAWGRFCEDALPWCFAAVVIVGLLASVDVVWRWRSGDPAERRGLGWLAIGAVVMAVSFAPLALPSQWMGNSVAVFTFTPIAHLIAQAFLPGAALVAILRQQMWGIDLAVSRTLVWSLLTGGLAGLYLVMVATAGIVVGDGAAAGVAGAAVALAIGPGRSWLQRRVDHLVRGDVSDAARAVRRMGRQLGGAAHDDDLLSSLAQGLRDSLRLASVAVEVPEDGEQRRTLVCVGEPSGETHEFALVLRSTTVGWLVTTTGPGLRLDTRSHGVVASVAPVVASAVALTDLTAEVNEVRDRLTAARVEERRLLRREIHDGLGPALAGIGLGLQAYRNLRDVDRARADELFDALCQEVEHRAGEVRTLSRALLPPVLEELGLVAALDELVARHDTPAMRITLDADVQAVVPMPIAAAAYAVVSEAVVNAHRHAGATQVSIRVNDTDGLRITIDDNGCGLPADLVPGIGIRSMAERAAELGGSCAITTSRRGGALVEARLPLGVGVR